MEAGVCSEPLTRRCFAPASDSPAYAAGVPGLSISASLAACAEFDSGLVTGDDVACEEAQQLLPDVELVQVKKAIDRFAAEVLPGAVTRPAIRAASQAAVRRAPERRSLVLSGPLHLAVLLTDLLNT